jgi:iron complex outermembrane receptor protein
VSFEFKPKSVFKSILLTGLVNNVFDYRYVSNGYFFTYDDNYSDPNQITTNEGAGYYPQAGINFLVVLTLNF